LETNGSTRRQKSLLRRCYAEHNGSAIRITALTSSGPKWSPERRCRFETFKKMLVQTVPCQAAALDLRNGRAAVLALRQMRYENAVRLVTRNHIRALQISHELAELERDQQVSHVATALQPSPNYKGGATGFHSGYSKTRGSLSLRYSGSAFHSIEGIVVGCTWSALRFSFHRVVLQSSRTQVPRSRIGHWL
jgi:hypothetical protein